MEKHVRRFGNATCIFPRSLTRGRSEGDACVKRECILANLGWLKRWEGTAFWQTTVRIKAGCTVGLGGRRLCGETPLKHVAWWNQKWGPQSAVLSLRFPWSEDSHEDKVKFVILWRKKAYKGCGLWYQPSFASGHMWRRVLLRMAVRSEERTDFEKESR